jgi:CxxC motif-containing protein (DUF1111 family)
MSIKWAIFLGLLSLCRLSEAQDNTALGGATTVDDASSNAFSLAVNNLNPARREPFVIGSAIFKQPWVAAPSSTQNRDGLGALFNMNSCQGCHIKAGKGHPPLSDSDAFSSSVVRLSIPAQTKAAQSLLTTLGVVPEPTYGNQLQLNAISGITGEATPRLSYSELQGQFKDGETYSLLKPSLHLEHAQYGGFASDLQTSVRVAPALIGLGLLASISESAILANADPEDKNGDGISGRANYVWDLKQQKTVVGRFGWKANQPTIEQQTANALQNDIGISSPLLPEANCSPKQTACRQIPEGGKPEISAEMLEKLVLFASLLAVPAQRNATDAQVLQGQLLFNQAGCISCHIANFRTANNETLPELAQQTIHPYSDLLLHDMGEGLADQRPDFLANGREWRTAPLWGIGLIDTVNGHTRYLHDGRARNLTEAILWHGGEAERAKTAFMQMSKSERAALIQFLQSL